MLSKIKNRIEEGLHRYIKNLDKIYSLSKISPLLFENIKDFVLRKGKRLRPTLFVIAYLGFKNKAVANLYTSALSIELLHDFLLVHDDIIDKSAVRRGKPSMHEALNRYLANYKNIKFSAEDLTIVVGDIMYAMSLHAFLSIKEDIKRKEMALKKFIDAAMYTAMGEFIELVYGLRDIDKITKSDIYKIYDFKTAYYTFAAPLAMGAILAGAPGPEVDKLFKCGIYLGRAFQIKDDLLGVFAEEKKIGKSNLTDLQEAKKTILIWYAYCHSDKKNKATIKKLSAKKAITKGDLLRIRKIITYSGALLYAKREILKMAKEAEVQLSRSKILPKYKNLLSEYSQEILKI